MSAVLLLGSVQATRGQVAGALDETARSAAFLLGSYTASDRRSLHPKMLDAVRQLHDPALEPLFDRFTQSPHPAMQVHGLLGLAQCDPSSQLDLARLAAIQEPAVQAQAVSAAMDDNLLTREQSQQLIGWPDMDAGVKIIIAAQLVKDHQFSDLDLLEEATTSNNLARKGLAAILLLQLGQLQALQTLHQLDQSNDTQRDPVRRMLLETALKYELNGVAQWATEVSTEANVDRKLGLLALRVAMRFGSPGAVDLWQHRFATTTDQAQRTRLALMALGLSPWLDAELFTPLVNDDDPLIQRIFKAAQAIASNHHIDAAVISLIEMHHPMMNLWALNYAKQYGTDEDAQVILLGLIIAFEDQAPNRRVQTRHQVVQATRILYERCPQAAATLLRPILANAEIDPQLAEGILLGLLDTTQPHADRVVAGLPAFDSPQANNLAIVLLAKHGRALSEPQIRQLRLLVRGGGGISQTLRLQAAWAYLKRTEQSQLALATALGM